MSKTSTKKPKGYYDNDLENIRLTLGLSVNEFAFKVGVTAQTIYDWEQGTRGPDWDGCQKIEAATGKSIQTIWAKSWGKSVKEQSERRKALGLMAMTE